jgi:beta-xylosidase
MSGHTPGPWAQSHRESDDGWYRTQVYPVADPNNTIATCNWHSVRTEYGHVTDRDANARLIAAAPELMEALRALADQVEEYELGNPDALRNARAAIAKAEGRS